MKPVSTILFYNI